MRFNQSGFKLLLLPIFFIFLTSGCWDVIDVDQRTIIIALGLDAAPNNQVIASAQIPIVETSPLSLGAQSPDKPFHTITNQDETALDAALGLGTKTIKSTFWGQLRVVVVNSALAERGLRKYSEFLERHPEIPPLVYMALTETTSQEILSVGLNSKFLPALAIENHFDAKEKIDETYPIRIREFIKRMESKTSDAYLPIISYDKDEQVYNLSGIGVFDHDRLIGKLTENETRMAGIVMSKPVTAKFVVPIGKMGKLTYRRVDAKRKITILRTEPNIEFLLQVSAKGFAPSITSDQTELSVKDIKKIEKITAESMKKDIMNILSRLQQLNSDIIGFGNIVRANKPEVWKRLNWDEDYPLAKFRVSVKFTLERVGKYR